MKEQQKELFKLKVEAKQIKDEILKRSNFNFLDYKLFQLPKASRRKEGEKIGKVIRD